ncbi:MAG: hypothetical protein H0W64_05355 [Gammaproteobacteria bacterium]|nr:hypothetical protein [Gammaproteobacteria bacterium]
MSNPRNPNNNNQNNNDDVFVAQFPPGAVDILDVNENGQVYHPDVLEMIKNEYLYPKKRKAFVEDKVSKHVIKKDLAKKLNPEMPVNFSPLFVKDNDKKERGFAVYEGKIGEGVFGGVKLAIDLETNEWVAIKIIESGQLASNMVETKEIADDDDAENMGTFEAKEDAVNTVVGESNITYDDEFTILTELAAGKARLDRKHVARNVNQNCLIMELAQGDPLSSLVKTESRTTATLADEEILEISVALLKSMHGLINNQGIIHRDIKPDNIMYDRAAKNLYLVDFGQAVKLSPDTRIVFDKVNGSPGWMAPEINTFAKLTLIEELLENSITLLDEINELQLLTNQLAKNEVEAGQERIGILKKYLDELKDEKNDMEIMLKKTTQALKSQRIRKQKINLTSYLAELKTNPEMNQTKIMELEHDLNIRPTSVKEAQDLQKRLSTYLTEYSAALTNKFDALVQEIESLQQNIAEENVDEVSYQQYQKKYLAILEKDLVRAHRKLNNKVGKLQNQNTNKNSDSIPIMAATLLKKTSPPVETPRWESVNARIIELSSFINLVDSAPEAAYQTIPRLIAGLKQEHASIPGLRLLERIKEGTKTHQRYSSMQKKVPKRDSKKLDFIEYSEATEIYSVGLVLLTLIQHMDKNSEIRKEILKNFFLLDWSAPFTQAIPIPNQEISTDPNSENFNTPMTPRLSKRNSFANSDNNNESRRLVNWEDVQARPTFEQALNFYERLLKQHEITKKPKDILMIDCVLFLNDRQEIDQAKVTAFINQFNHEKHKEIILVSMNTVPFQTYAKIRSALHQENIYVNHNIILTKHVVSPHTVLAKAEPIINKTVQKNINLHSNQLTKFLHEWDTLQLKIQNYDDEINRKKTEALNLPNVRKEIVTQMQDEVTGLEKQLKEANNDDDVKQLTLMLKRKNVQLDRAVASEKDSPKMVSWYNKLAESKTVERDQSAKLKTVILSKIDRVISQIEALEGESSSIVYMRANQLKDSVESIEHHVMMQRDNKLSTLMENAKKTLEAEILKHLPSEAEVSHPHVEQTKPVDEKSNEEVILITVTKNEADETQPIEIEPIYFSRINSPEDETNPAENTHAQPVILIRNKEYDETKSMTSTQSLSNSTDSYVEEKFGTKQNYDNETAIWQEWPALLQESIALVEKEFKIELNSYAAKYKDDETNDGKARKQFIKLIHSTLDNPNPQKGLDTLQTLLSGSLTFYGKAPSHHIHFSLFKNFAKQDTTLVHCIKKAKKILNNKIVLLSEADTFKQAIEHDSSLQDKQISQENNNDNTLLAIPKKSR